MSSIPQKNKSWYYSKQGVIAFISIFAILLSLHFRVLGSHLAEYRYVPLWIAYLCGGIPLLLDLGKKMLRGEFGSDILAGISIVTSLILGEYLAVTLIILMLSGGEALEE